MCVYAPTLFQYIGLVRPCLYLKVRLGVLFAGLAPGPSFFFRFARTESEYHFHICRHVLAETFIFEMFDIS